MTDRLTATGAAVTVTLGDGVELMIDIGGTLAIVTRKHGLVHDRIYLGKATTKRFIELQNHLGRLIIHAVDA